MSGVLQIIGKRFAGAAYIPRMNPFIRIRCHGPLEEFQRQMLGELHAFAFPGATMLMAIFLGFGYIARELIFDPGLTMFTVVPVFLQRFAEPDARRKYDDGRDEDDSKIPNSWALWGRHPNYGVLNQPFLDILDREAKSRGFDGVDMKAEGNSVFTSSIAESLVNQVREGVQGKV
eukprot:TRINITY_DN3990_c0_g1_i1.p1 TRINITY_DN3990_c0_g1~~TRINITY_DN3990_c0_g1_i1.p1  ORF type:complete len:175 (-),score=17.15 TRINITY_DN3990_c0_g1_i1:109-633(-)